MSAASVILLALSWWSAVGLTAAVVFVAFCGFWAYVWYLYFPIVVRLLGQTPLLVPEPTQPIAGGEACAFRTADGLTLRGTYLKQRGTDQRGAERRGVILFGHELKGDRWNATPYVADLLDAGYDVFTFDFRNHGTSETDEKYTPRPWITEYDAADMRAAIDYLTSRADADPRGIGVLAISRAGGAALTVVGGDPRVRCLFTDGAYPSRTTHLIYIRRYVDIYVPANWHWLSGIFPDWGFELFLTRARKVWGRANNYPFVDVEHGAKRVTQPTLMIHGAADKMIPAEAARVLRDCITGPSKIWVVPEAGHNAAVFTVPEAYRRRLLKFFRLHLGPRPQAGRGRATDAAASSTIPS